MFNVNKLILGACFSFLAWQPMQATGIGQKMAVMAAASLSLAKELKKALIDAQQALGKSEAYCSECELEEFQSKWLCDRRSIELLECEERLLLTEQKIVEFIDQRFRHQRDALLQGYDKRLENFERELVAIASEGREKDEALTEQRTARAITSGNFSLPILHLAAMKKSPREQALTSALDTGLTPRAPSSTPRKVRPKRSRSLPIRMGVR